MVTAADTPRGASRQRDLASSMAADFDATALANKIHDMVGEDRQLAQLVDAAAMADQCHEIRDEMAGADAETPGACKEAWGQLSNAARVRAREVVAEACAEMCRDGDEWTDVWPEADIEAAQAEASTWLRMNTNVSDRLGLLGVA